MTLLPYDTDAAVRYAHRWAFGRNPRYYDYEALGGDCTNFASQCLYAGSHIMDFTPTFGWYYIDANRKAPAWTGVPYLYNYLTRPRAAPGPAAREVTAPPWSSPSARRRAFWSPPTAPTRTTARLQATTTSGRGFCILSGCGGRGIIVLVRQNCSNKLCGNVHQICK